MEAYDPLEGIAVIGMAGRFSGAENVDAFWRNLCDGREMLSRFTEQEMMDAGVDPTLLRKPAYVRAGSVLEGVELFDAAFFDYNPREAEMLDPQQRLFLECGWEALENAGYDPTGSTVPVGVYAGASMNSYLLNNILSNPEHIKSVGRYQAMIGNDKDFLTTRLSYKLNLRGPSLDIQTACSTSLVAVQVACQSLLNYQCDMALAGGVSLSIPQKTGYLHQEGMIMSPDGHCRAFDAQAQGTVGGQGAGVVVLKRLEEALADMDSIYAVIKGAAINNDGAMKVGFTAPSVDGQTEVIAMAHALAGVEAETITYVEAHGTATPMGDPIEITALTEAFRLHSDRKSFCAIGSVKTNIGHLDAAAGVAGLIKTSMALKHGILPPSLHFEKPNPEIDFAGSPFYVNTSVRAWPKGGSPRRAGVSSFGIGGTNAHVVLEEAPGESASGPSRPWQLLLLSAKSAAALEAASASMAAHFKEQPGLNLADAAFTLRVGRTGFDHRRALVCRDLEEAAGSLAGSDPGRAHTAVKKTDDRQVVYMFSGQGAQYANMGSGLYQSESTFREQVDLCAEYLKPLLGLDLRDALFPDKEHLDETTAQLLQTRITQPALFVVEYALARLWQEWGVQPEAMIGHSIGEYVAACLGGVFSLEEALSLVAARGRLMQELPGGAMLAVAMPEEGVRPLLGGQLSLAAVNGASLCVVSGPVGAIDEIEGEVTRQGVSCRRLHTSHAFHSEMMDSIVTPFTEQVRLIALRPSRIPFISNVTGTWITAEEATDPVYWARHLRQTVRFSDGVRELLKEPRRIYLEVGPGHTLSSLVRQHADKTAGQEVLSSVRHPHDQQQDVPFMLSTLGRLWLAGCRVDWAGFHKGEKRRRIPLPTYPFERQRYWIEPRRQPDRETAREASLEKKSDIADWFYIPSWKRTIPPGFSKDVAPGEQGQSWLVFVDESGFGDELVKGLKESGQDVVSVVAGGQFKRTGKDSYMINPQARDDYGALLGDLMELGEIPGRIVHLWGVASIKKADTGFEFLEKSQCLGFYSLLFLAQAVGEIHNSKNIHIEVVTNGVHDVTGADVLCPERATVLGPCKTIPQEYPNIKCRCIDIVLPASGRVPGEELTGRLIAEFASKPSGAAIAYRGRHRWVQTYERVQLDGTPEAARSLLRERGVYCITGGLGGVGFALAEHLAQSVQAKLILIEETAFPERNQWDQWIGAHDELDVISRKIHRIKSFEELGSEVLVLSADVADAIRMKAKLSEAQDRFGSIHGVVHAAEVAGDGIIQLKTREAAERVLSPKVKGTLVLEKLFNDLELDFFVLCSSISSLLGGIGQVDYCAANAFLDAYANRNFRNNHSISVNWYDWQATKAAAEAAVSEDPEEWAGRGLKYGIVPEEGKEAFDRILSSPCPQVVVSTQDFVTLAALSEDAVSSNSMDKAVKAPLTKPANDRPDLPTAYAAPRNELEQAIAGIWQELLGIDRVGIHDDFFELGGHSLLATQVSTRLSELFKMKFSLRRLLETTTVSTLAEVIDTLTWSTENRQTIADTTIEERDQIVI